MMNRIFILAKAPARDSCLLFSFVKRVFIPFIPSDPEIQSSILCIPSLFSPSIARGATLG